MIFSIFLILYYFKLDVIVIFQLFSLLLPIIFILLTLDFILIQSLNSTTYIIIYYYFIILSQLIANYHFISDHHQSDSHYSAVFLN